MCDSGDSERSAPTRRHLLAAGAGATLGAASGCLQRVRTLVDRPATDQLSLHIKTLPADADGPATRIARFLADRMEAVGIEADITLLREDELRRDVLTKGEFDVYVYRMPLGPDPDFLRARLHSVFKGEPGWQNPFGITSIELDEGLDEQRRLASGARRTAVESVLETVAELQPFVPVAVADEISATRDENFGNWRPNGLDSPTGFLQLEARESDPAGTLRVVGTDPRTVESLNPIAAQFRDRGVVTGLLYEPLGRRVGDGVGSWLARDWEWDEGGANTTVRVRLREDLSWHDGESLTAEDVAFTYRFLNDTTLGDREATVPAPRYRGRTSLVADVEVASADVVRLDVGDATAEVGERALTVPILPRHVWRERSNEAELAGVEVNERVTEALVWNNREPIGSGPVAYGSRPNQETLVLERYDEHFLHRGVGDPPAESVAGGVDFETLQVRVAPSSTAAVQLVVDDAADATVPMTAPDVVPQIGQASDVTLRVGRSPWLYHVGFDTDVEVLGNPHVRRTIARLLDKAWIVSEVLDGYGQPAPTPLAGTGWVPQDLAWDGTDPEVPFVGTEGVLDVGAARELFREIGFQYEDDRLLDR